MPTDVSKITELIRKTIDLCPNQETTPGFYLSVSDNAVFSGTINIYKFKSQDDE